jgi:hypothetical protein
MGERMTVAGRDIEIKRLTMADIRDIVGELKQAGQEGSEPHIIDVFFNHDVPVAALRRATGLGDHEFGSMDPEELFALLEAVKRVNVFFVETMASRFYSRATQSAPSSTESVS